MRVDRAGRWYPDEYFDLYVSVLVEGVMMNDFIKEHGKEFVRTLVAVVVALSIAAPPVAQFIDDTCVSIEEVIQHVGNENPGSGD